MQGEFREYPFLEYYKKYRSKKFIIRCLACHYIQQGSSYKVVSKIVRYSKQTLGKWVSKFKDGGIDTLLEIKAGRGRKAKIPISEKERFTKLVSQLQKDRLGGRVIGEDIVKMIQEKYKYTYSVSGVYKILERMNMSWVSSRSVHPKVDLVEQEAFKEDFLKASKRNST